MVQDDLGADGDVFQGLAEERGLGVHKGDEIERIEVALVQEPDVQTHGPDEFPVLLAGHRLRRDQGAPGNPRCPAQNLLQRHRRRHGVRIGAAVHEDGRRLFSPDHGLQFENIE